VFRYALERWRPDNYEVVVFYDQELSAADRKLVDRMQLEAYERPELGNLNALTVDVNSLREKWLQELWRQQGSQPELPRAVVVAPQKPNRGAVVWSGPLAKFDLPSLRDSPARQELSKRLVAGDSIVWLIVADKQTQGVAEAQKLIAEQLSALQEEILLPPGIGDPGSELLSKTPLAIRFSSLLVDASLPAEKSFVEMLFAQGSQTKTLKQPLIVPVFGRGRAFDTLPAEELSPEVIADACRFLCGACSCRVKEQSPGFDLLLAAAWLPTGDASSATGVEDRGASEPQTIAIPPGNAPQIPHSKVADVVENSPATAGRSHEWWLVAIISAAVCLMLVLFPLSRSSSANHSL